MSSRGVKRADLPFRYDDHNTHNVNAHKIYLFSVGFFLFSVCAAFCCYFNIFYIFYVVLLQWFIITTCAESVVVETEPEKNISRCLIVFNRFSCFIFHDIFLYFMIYFYICIYFPTVGCCLVVPHPLSFT